MNNLAIFASGSGTNAENIIRFFRTDPETKVKIVLSNRPEAFVLNRASNLGIETVTFTRDEFRNTNKIINILIDREIDLIILAGFLWLIPEYLVSAFPDRIVNIHPALLPKFGGKGMYGSRVHEAVIAQGESESGITIHYVNEKYDEGNIIFQARCTVEKDETPESLAKKVHKLEYEHFPRVILDLSKTLNSKL